MGKQSNISLNSNKCIKFILLIWGVYLIETLIGPGSFTKFGILPREYIGLPGIFLYTFIHGDFVHLTSNTITLFIFLWVLYNQYSNLAAKVIFKGTILTGFLVWCFARKNIHIGASGLIYVLAGFLIASGYYRKEGRSFLISFIILLTYGTSMFWGVLPTEAYISYESHLFGAITGIYLAKKYQNIY